MIFIITELLSIDLLDTSGDWLQFISLLVLSWIVPTIIVNFMNFYNYSSKISSIVLAIVLWKVVYDYDYIFGILTGSVIGLVWAYSKLNNNLDKSLKKSCGLTLFSHFLNGLVMLLKILIFII
tara:strand:+ start:340 stop:708 length:369 start_codon:yes stop_codon:yes gene_type:complete